MLIYFCLEMYPIMLLISIKECHPSWTLFFDLLSSDSAPAVVLPTTEIRFASPGIVRFVVFARVTNRHSDEASCHFIGILPAVSTVGCFQHAACCSLSGGWQWHANCSSGCSQLPGTAAIGQSIAAEALCPSI